MMILKELFARLGLDVDEVGFNRADALLGGLKKGLVALGAFAAGAAVGVGALVEKTRAAADKLDKIAPGLGLTTDAMQELDHAANLSGVNIDLLGNALVKLQNNAAAAADGGQQQAAAFTKLGIAVKNADGSLRSSDELLMSIADAIAAMPTGTAKSAAAFDLFGKQGAKLLPLLNGGSKALAEMRQEAHDLGAVLDSEAIAAGVALTDTKYRIDQVIKGIQFAVAGPLLSSFNDVGMAILSWAKANRVLIKERIDKVITLLKLAVMPLLFVLSKTATVTGWLIDNWKLLALVLGSVVVAALVLNTGALWALVTANAAAGAASVKAAIKAGAAWALANAPLIALTGLFLLFFLIIEDVSTALEGGDSLLKQWLADWKDDNPNDPWWLRAFKTLVYGILHFDDVWSFWRRQFSEFWEWLVDGFNDVSDSIVKKFKSFFGFGDSEGRIHFGKEGFSSDEGRGPGAWRRIGPDGELRFFPAPAVERGGSSGGGGSTFNAEFNITTNPNQSPGEIANEARSQFDEWHQNQLEAAYSAVE